MTLLTYSYKETFHFAEEEWGLRPQSPLFWRKHTELLACVKVAIGKVVGCQLHQVRPGKRRGITLTGHSDGGPKLVVKFSTGCLYLRLRRETYMSEQNPYEKLGVTEDATFDEIQDARGRLVQHYTGDSKHIEAIEAAYDAILMERLRMRQEGKIKVPEGIRFAERLAQAPPKESPAPTKKSAVWLQRLLDKPSLPDILLPGVLFLALIALSVFYTTANNQVLQMSLLVGVGASLYFVNRKEQKFGRAVLLTVLGLIIGLVIGGLFGNLLQAQIANINLTVEQFSTVVTFILLWLVSSFLR